MDFPSVILLSASALSGFFILLIHSFKDSGNSLACAYALSGQAIAFIASC
jgi:hypothetical protein